MSHTHVHDQKTQESEKPNEKSAERKGKQLKRRTVCTFLQSSGFLLVLLVHVFQMFHFFRSGKMKRGVSLRG